VLVPLSVAPEPERETGLDAALPALENLLLRLAVMLERMDEKELVLVGMSVDPGGRTLPEGSTLEMSVPDAVADDCAVLRRNAGMSEERHLGD
jgi:hypothetical protein